MIKKILFTVILLAAIVSPAQQTVKKDSGTITVSGGAVGTAGGAFQLNNDLGMVTNGFEVVITGTPSTVSVITKGCMRGGTCDTLDTYTTVANANRKPSISVAYDYFEISATWTGGTSPTVRINRTATLARSGASGAGGAVSSVFSQTGAVPDLSGDVTTGGSSVTTLKNTGTAGQYTKVTFDAQGRETSGTTLIASDIPAIAESGVTSLVSDLAAKATTAGTLGQFAATSSSAFFGVINDETGGTGLVVGNQSPTLVTPTIASMVNANHNHSAGAGGGVLAFGTAIPNLSGDATTSGSSAITLAASGVSGTTCGDATHSCTLTYDAKGRITAATNPTISAGSGTVTHVPGALTAGQLVIGNGAADITVGNLSGDVTTSGGTATLVKQIHHTTILIAFAQSPYTVLATDGTIVCDASSGAVVINLPASAGNGKQYIFKKTDSTANACTVTRAGADTIDGLTTLALTSQNASSNIWDSSSGKWLKISPNTPGSSGNILYNAGGQIAAVADTQSDNSHDTSGGTASSALSIVRTYTGGSATTGTMHLFDGTLTLTSAVTQHENTASFIYGTMIYNGTGGCGHCINFTSRIQYGGTTNTTDELDNYYADTISTGNPTDTVTLSTRYYALTGAIVGTGASTWVNDAGFRNSILTFTATPSLTVGQGFVTDMPTADNAKIGAFYGVRVGGAIKSGKYVSIGMDGGELYLQQGIEQTFTLDNTAATNLTKGGFTTGGITSADRRSIFCTQATTCAVVDWLLTNNVASSTSVMMNLVHDNGGATTPTSQTTAKFAFKNSGAGTSTKAIAASLVALGSGTYTDATLLDMPDMNSGATYTNLRRAIDQKGTGDWNVFKGPLSIQQGSAPGSAVASGLSLYADTTSREMLGAVNGGTTFGMFARVGCQTSQKAETAADTSLLSCTPISAAGRYRVRFTMSLSAASAATIGWTITYTDSNGNAQTPTNLSLYQQGTAAPALTFTTSAAGNYYGFIDIDVNNAGTAIVVKTTFSGTSFAGKASATIEKLI